MKTEFTLKDVKPTDYIVRLDEDGNIVKEGSFKVTYVGETKLGGRGYKKRSDYGCSFDLAHFEGRVLVTEKEFKSNKRNTFDAKTFIEKTLIDMNITFSKVQFRKKVLYKARWEDVLGTKYPAQYETQIVVENSNVSEMKRDNILIWKQLEDKLQKEFDKKMFRQTYKLNITFE